MFSFSLSLSLSHAHAPDLLYLVGSVKVVLVCSHDVCKVKYTTGGDVIDDKFAVLLLLFPDPNTTHELLITADRDLARSRAGSSGARRPRR